MCSSRGEAVERKVEITGEDVLAMLGGPVGSVRLKCAFLALEAVKKAVST